MLESVGTLFDGLGIIPMIIFAIGIIFCLIEIFVPGFGVFGILGSIFIVGGVIGRYFLDYDIQHLIIMVMFVITIIAIAILIMWFSVKHGMLSRSPIIENKTAISTSVDYDDKELLKLLGKITFAETQFIPTGRFTYNDESYCATSYGEYIEKGSKIQIVEVSGTTIYVKKVI